MGGGNKGYLLRNDGGQFVPFEIEALSELMEPELASGDIDGDGKTDLAVCGRSQPSKGVLHILRNTGDFGFENVTHQLGGAAQGGLAFFKQQGGSSDAVVVNGLEGTNFGALQWTGGLAVAISGLPPGSDFGAFAAVDMDLDGDFDLICTGQANAGLRTTVFRKDPLGYVALLPSVPLPAMVHGGVATLDWNQDGHPDLHFWGIDHQGLPVQYLLTYDITLQTYQP
jgi:hypothetical protein